MKIAPACWDLSSTWASTCLESEPSIRPITTSNPTVAADEVMPSKTLIM